MLGFQYPYIYAFSMETFGVNAQHLRLVPSIQTGTLHPNYYLAPRLDPA